MGRASSNRGLVFALSAALTSGGCTAIFGLEEATVRDGEGGAAPSATGTGSAPAGATSGDGPGSGGTDASSSTGAGGCDDDDECEDGDPCTDDVCDGGECTASPAPDGPLAVDADDCIDRGCKGGVLEESIDDSEDPPDANPPCDTTICVGGIPTTVYADPETSCGEPPLVCDGGGLCVGCDPEGPDSVCGAPTECSTPTCQPSGVCDPGYAAAGPTATDLVPGNCHRNACTGSSAAAVDMVDDGDTPPATPCGTGTCVLGSPGLAQVAEGDPCNGEIGVCDGNGTALEDCVGCLEAAGASPTNPAPGCTFATPYCDKGTCFECLREKQCASYNADAGRECIDVSQTCGCDDTNDCSTAPNGPVCSGTTCTCTSNSGCTTSPRGSRCINSTDTCGCAVASDCVLSSRGNACVDEQCGCEDDDDCDGAATCNLEAHRCG